MGNRYLRYYADSILDKTKINKLMRITLRIYLNVSVIYTKRFLWLPSRFYYMMEIDRSLLLEYATAGCNELQIKRAYGVGVKT